MNTQQLFNKHILLLIFLLSVFALASGCATQSKPERYIPPVAGEPAGPIVQTLAILPFENNSVTMADHYSPLCKGLSAMLITDLKQRSSGLTLIERAKISELLNELELSQAGMINDTSAVRVGKMLGAENLVFGSFMVINGSVRIDARLVNVETAEVILAQSAHGGKDEFISLQVSLADKIADSLHICLAPTLAKNNKGKMDAALWFSKGVKSMDKGDVTQAKEYFEMCQNIDPAYSAHISALMRETVCK